jgi:membrane protein required for colicin V production
MILGGWMAFRFHEKAAVLLSWCDTTGGCRMIAFVTLLILVGLAAHLLGNLLTNLVSLALLGWVNRIGGMVLGCLEGSTWPWHVFLRRCHDTVFLSVQGDGTKTSIARPLAQLGGTAIDQPRVLRQTTP